jgi:glyoxylase-like metal-dependent hydrolase (beta-lactamase superfamily II)
MLVRSSCVAGFVQRQRVDGISPHAMAGMVLPEALLFPPVSQLSARVMRVMGHNVSAMTLGGSNTYVVGTGRQRLLIDTGEGKPAYRASLSEALQPHGISISHVLLTHWHRDHIGGLADVVGLFPGAVVRKKHTAVTSALHRVAADTRDGDVFCVEGATVRAVMTPGHTDDHMCLVLEEENALFSGDHIIGWGTAAFSCYADYHQSLEKLKRRAPALIYPAHGPVITDAPGKIDEYIAHRQKREAQVLECLATGSAADVHGMVKIMYDGLAENLVIAATLNVIHHVKKLKAEGRVVVAAEAALSGEQRAALLVGDYEASASAGMLKDVADRAAEVEAVLGLGKGGGGPVPPAAAAAAEDNVSGNDEFAASMAFVNAFATVKWRLRVASL